MSNKITIAIVAALVPLASGQTAAPPTAPDQERTFKFAHAETPQQIEEIATLIRVIGDIKQFSVDESQGTMSVRGTSDQTALAGWLFNEFDRAGNQQPEGQTSADLEYRLSVAGDNLVRVFYLPYAKTVQQFQEAATLVRSILDIRRLFTFNAPRAAVARGTVDQIAAAAWLFNELSKPVDQNSAAAEYRLPLGNNGPEANANIVRVFHLPQTKTVRDFQEVATLVRSLADIRRLFTYNDPRAMAMRGTLEQAGFAEWLVNELDKSAPHSAASSQYRIPGEGNESLAQVFYLPESTAMADFQRIAQSVRVSTGIRRGFTYNSPRAIAFRGTDAQIAQAAQLIVEQTKPN